MEQHYPIYIPLITEDRLESYVFVKNKYTNKKYFLGLTIVPTFEILNSINCNNIKPIKDIEELNDLYKILSSADNSIDGVYIYDPINNSKEYIDL